MGRNKSEMNKVPKVAKTGEFVLILWKKIDRNNKLSWSIQPVSTVKNLLQLQNPQICDKIESRLTNKPFKDCESHMGYVVSRGTKSALEKNPGQTIEDFHKLLTDVNNSQASTSEDNDEEEDDDAENQTDEEDQSKPDDSSSEHSNAKSSSGANKKDQQIATSNSNRKRTADKDFSNQLSDAPRASADLDDISSEHSKAKSSSGANKKDQQIVTSNSNRKRTSDKDFSNQLSDAPRASADLDDISSEHSNAKSSSGANKKDQQIATSNSNRKRTADKDFSNQLSDAPRASADLDDISSEHSKAKSSSGANKKDQQIVTSNSNRKRTSDKDFSNQLSDAPRASADLDDISSEHSNAKSSSDANKKDQQIATSNSNRKRTASKDYSYQLSADLDDSFSDEHSKEKSSSGANKKDHRIETSTSISRKRSAEKECSYQLSAGAKKQYQVDEIDQAKTIASLTSILAKREEEIGKLRDENQRLKEKNLFLQDGLPQVISKLAKSNKSEQAPERWENEEVQNALSKLELSPRKVKQLREKNKSSLLARTCLKFCFDEDVIARSVVVGGNQQKDAEAPKLDSDVLDNICDLVMARFPGAERKAIMSTFTLTTRDVKNKAKDK